MPTLAELRASLGEAGNRYTDEQLYAAAKTAFAPLYSDPKILDRELGYDPENDFTRGLKIAGRNTLAAGGGVLAAGADAVGATGLRDRALEYGRGQQQQAYQMSRRSDDVDNFTEDPLSFLSAGAGQAIGYAVPSLLGGGAGALAGRAVGMGALRGGLAGSYATNVGQQTGGIYNELAEQGLYEPGRALAFGAGTAVLDTIPEALGVGRLAKGVGGWGGLGRGLAVGAGTEAVTEVGQTVGERYAAYKPLGDDEAFKEYRNAAALGALGGGMFGGATGFMGQADRPARPALDDKNPTDLLGQYNLTTEQSPEQFGALVQQRWGLPGQSDKGQVEARQAEMEAMFAAPSGKRVQDPATGTERELTVGELFDMQERNRVTRDPFATLPETDWAGYLQGDTPYWSPGPQPSVTPPTAPEMGDMPGFGQEYPGQAGGVAPDSLPAGFALAPGQTGQAGSLDRPSGFTTAGFSPVGEAQQLKADLEAAKQRVAEKTAQRQALEAEANEFGLKGTRLVDMYGELKALKGTIPQDEYENAISALQGNRVPAVRKTIKQYTPQEAQGGQPNVPATAGVAQGAVPGGSAQPAGGSGNLGQLVVDGVGRSTDAANAPVPSGTAVAPVGDGAGRRAPALDDGTVASAAEAREKATVEVDPATGAKVTKFPTVAPVKATADRTAETEEEANFRRTFAQRLQGLDTEDRALLEQWLGVEVNADGELELTDGQSLSTLARGLQNTKTGGVGMSRQAVKKRLDKALETAGAPAGISPKQLYTKLGFSLSSLDLDSLDRMTSEVAELSGDARTAGFDRVVESDNVRDDTTDIRVERGDEGLVMAPDETAAERSQEDDVATTEVAAPDSDPESALDSRETVTDRLDKILAADVKRGAVTADDISEAGVAYDSMRSAGMPAWARLTEVDRAAAVRAYARLRATGHPDVIATKRKIYEQTLRDRAAGRTRPNADTAAAGATAQGSEGGGADAGRAQGSDAGGGVGGAEVQGNRPAPVVVTKKRRTVQKPVEDGAGWAGGLQSASTSLRRPSPTPAQNRPSTLEEVSGLPGFIAGLKSLADLGIEHAVNWVSDWSLGKGAWYTPSGTRQRVGLEPAESVQKSGQARFDFVHETGHAVDMAGYGGVYSAQPELAFTGTGAGIKPSGEIAREVAQAREMAKGTLLADLLAYPYDLNEFGDIVRTHGVASNELFAQLFAIHAHPTLRAMLEIAAPKAAQFMKDVVADVKQSRPLQAHTPATATQRRQAFAAKRNQRGPGVGVAAGNARQAQLAAGQTLGEIGRRLRNVSDRQVADRLNQLERLQVEVDKRTPARVKSAGTNIRDFFKKNAPYLLTNFQLTEQFGGKKEDGKIESLAKYTRIADLMRVESTQQQMKFDEVAKRWDKLPKQAREALNSVALRATLQEMHPDLPFDHKDNAHLAPEKKAQHATLAAEYKRMGTEAQKVYQDAKRTMDESYDTMVSAVEKLKADYGLAKSLPNRVPGPYFPLLRFGDYLAIGESAEYKAKASELATATGARAEELREEVNTLKRDPKHYVVSAHESRSEMEQAAAEYGKQGLDARVTTADQRLDALPKDLHKMVHEMAATMAKQFDGETANAVVDAYTQMLMKSLPEMHALHRQAARKGVEGASPDMLRAFAANGRQSAFYTARLLHAKGAADALVEMRAETKGKIDLEHIHREMEKRAAMNLQFMDTPIQDMAGTLGWLYYLGASPTYLFMNALQPWLVTGPVLSGKFGFGKASKALGRASADAMKVLKDARWDGKNWDLWKGISEDSIPGKSVNEERKALRELMKRGIVDEGMQHEMAMFAEGGNRSLARLSRGVGWAAQQIELVNRVATALATFRLARESGMDYDAAVQEAYATTVNTQMDYSAENTARFMRTGGGIPLAKLLFQFRRYQQGMLYLLGSNIKKLTNAQERKTAAATLAYFAVTSGLSAGVMGLPFMGTALVIANAFRDDDDEDGSAETVLRNALFDLTGDREMATVLAKGIPAMFGADLSARIGLGNLMQLYPYLELDGKTGQDNVGKVLTNVAGPVIGGLGSSVFDAFTYMRAGDMYKATEKLLPKMVADPLKGARYWTEGFTDRKGDEILGPEEVGIWNSLIRAMGTTSTTEANYYEGNAAMKDVQMAARDRKTRIGNQYKRALRSGDMESVREMIDEFNEDHPSNRITPKDELNWRKTARKSAGQRDESGIRFDPRRDKNYEELMRFAR